MFLCSSNTQDMYLALVLSDGYVRLLHNGEVLEKETGLRKGKYILLDSNFEKLDINAKEYLRRHIYAKSIYRKIMKFILLYKQYSISEFFDKFIWSHCSHLADLDTKILKELDEKLYDKIFNKPTRIYSLRIEESKNIIDLKTDLQDNGVMLTKVKNGQYNIEGDIDMNEFYEIVISSCIKYGINILDICSVN